MGNTKSLPPLQTVSNCEVSRFMGTWFVIAVKPTMFERTNSNAVDTYTLVEHKRHDVRIDFSYYDREDPYHRSRFKSLTQKGYIDKTDSARWRVSPFFPIKVPYLIIELDGDNYEYCVVGYPTRDYAWIMSRTPNMDETLYDELCTKLKETHAYDLKGLRKVPQKWTREERAKRGFTEKEIPDDCLMTNDDT